jgi:hypothetical protein
MPKSRTGGSPLVRCPPLLIQYIRGYPPYPEATSLGNAGMSCHAVTGARMNADLPSEEAISVAYRQTGCELPQRCMQERIRIAIIPF